VWNEIKTEPPFYHSMTDELKQAILHAAELMAISARTAPKARGMDAVDVRVVKEEDLERLAEEMERVASETGMSFFRRDAESVRMSDAVLLVSVDASEPKGLDCGGCGYGTCEEFREAVRKSGRGYRGPSCVLYVLDLGIAVGSAVKTASMLNVDNRVMYSVGVAALRLGMVKGNLALGIPLSATGKSIYFDRKR